MLSMLPVDSPGSKEHKIQLFKSLFSDEMTFVGMALREKKCPKKWSKKCICSDAPIMMDNKNQWYVYLIERVFECPKLIIMRNVQTSLFMIGETNRWSRTFDVFVEKWKSDRCDWNLETFLCKAEISTNNETGVW